MVRRHRVSRVSTRLDPEVTLNRAGVTAFVQSPRKQRQQETWNTKHETRNTRRTDDNVPIPPPVGPGFLPEAFPARAPCASHYTRARPVPRDRCIVYRVLPAFVTRSTNGITDGKPSPADFVSSGIAPPTGSTGASRSSSSSTPSSSSSSPSSSAAAGRSRPAKLPFASSSLYLRDRDPSRPRCHGPIYTRLAT